MTDNQTQKADDDAAKMNADIAAFEAGEARQRELEAQVAELETENATLKRQLAAQKGQVTRAKAETRELREAGTQRKFGAPKPPKKGEEADQGPTADYLLDLLELADDVEIVASDGRAEIEGVPGFGIPVGGLVERRGQLVLDVPSLRVTGPNTGTASRTIAGFALVVDGEQVAWASLPDAIPLAAGHEYELKDSVVFGVPITV